MSKAKRKLTDKTVQVCEAPDYRALTALEIHPDNPRTISRDRLDDLKRSIIDKGLYKPFLIWKKGNIILSGNQRYRALVELIDDGYTFVAPNGSTNEFPVVFEDVSEDTAEAILFDDNNHYGDWVEEKLQIALSQAKEAGKNLATFGFTGPQIDDLLKDAMKGADEVAKTSKVGEHERTKGEGKEEDDREAASEKQEALILPKSTYLKLVDIFQDIAYQLDPSWRDGMSIVPAVEAFIEFTLKEGVPDIEEWSKEQAKEKRKGK